MHYDEIPESDITTVDGLRVTTPIRTVIDIAAETPPQDLERIIQDCLDRGLFTVEEARERLDQPDMACARVRTWSDPRWKDYYRGNTDGSMLV